MARRARKLNPSAFEHWCEADARALEAACAEASKVTAASGIRHVVDWQTPLRFGGAACAGNMVVTTHSLRTAFAMMSAERWEAARSALAGLDASPQPLERSHHRLDSLEQLPF
ncbi:hypothetical protein [Stenotrophomonas maltophilia]|uniref:hypothetical protein n=1 Tax=Stenotrophomonas maltophilia TaxID=40324 RepID=UPI002B1DF4AC|nr:hypothetical protein [Stenotrophomonas maltophilia]